MTQNIFLSYRRDDSRGYTNAIYTLLELHFPADSIFMDVDTLVPGSDFVQSLEDAVENCDIFLAVIGKSWENIEDHKGTRRLENPEDFVRIEVAHALKRGIPVIPVLVDGAQMPFTENLPDNIKSLARRHAFSIGDHLRSDVQRLIKVLEKTFERLEKERFKREKKEAEVLARAQADEERKTQEKAEAERIAKEKAEADRIAKEKAEADRIAKEKAEADRITKEKVEADRKAKEKAEADRIAKEKAEADRRAKEKAEADRITKEKAEADRKAKEKAEADRIAKEKAEADRRAKEKAEADRITKEKAEADRKAKEKAEADRIAKEKAEADRKAKEKAEADRIAKEKAEADRIAKEKAEADRIAKEKAEADRKAKEKAEADRISKEKAETDRIAKEKAEADRIAKEEAEADRIAKEKAEADRLAKEKAEADRIAKEKAEADRKAKEKAEADRIAKEKAEADRLAKEKAEAEKKAKAQAEAEQKAKKERDKKARALAAAEKKEANRLKRISRQRAKSTAAAQTEKAISPSISVVKKVPVWAWPVAGVVLITIGYAIFGGFSPASPEEPGETGVSLAVPADTNTPTSVVISNTPTLEPTSTSTPEPTVTSTAVPTHTPTPEPSAGAELSNLTDGAVMVYVPSGEFIMGSDSWETDESPAHTVYLDGFWIGKTEVTNAMYRLCVEADACFEGWHAEQYTNAFWNNYPVVSIDWKQANSYCRWAGGDLPTEAQWEKAARGGDGRTYPWGEGIDNSLANYGGYVGAAYPVGSYSGVESPYGLWDMAGNVAEFVNDWYDPSYYSISPVVDPLGPGTGHERVVRGGHWNNDAEKLRVTRRYSVFPDDWELRFVGFRCAYSPTPQGEAPAGTE